MVRRLILLWAGAIPALLSAQDASVFGVFVGSTPADERIRQLLRIPAGPKAEVMEWTLVLYQDPDSRTPTRYDLRCQYGLPAAGKPGLARGAQSFQRIGAWKSGAGTKANPRAAVVELAEAVTLLQLDRNILQVLDAGRELLAGNAGWSYTLHRAEAAERPVDAAAAQPEMTYELGPLAAGPRIFAVLEGRTPCQGIARELRIPVDAACAKAKWRVTLYQNPVTKAPATYKAEGSLFGRNARSGNWSLTRGTPGDPEAVIYELRAAAEEPPILLLRGDENVCFFLDAARRPLVGNAEFSYTLNRR